MKKVIPMKMICAIFSIICLQSGQVVAGEFLTELDVEGHNMRKWVFEQKTDVETVAVMKVEHEVSGTPVKVYEEVFYSPDQAVLGPLILFKDHRPASIKLPTSNTLSLLIDEHWDTIKVVHDKITSVDGKVRQCQRVQFFSARESVVISFYSAPMMIFREVLPDMPDPAKGESSKFTWRHATLDGSFSITTFKSKDGTETTTAEVGP